MTEAELIFTALAKPSTRQIAEKMDATGLPENTAAAKAGGGIAKQARKQLESQTGKSVVSKQNYLAHEAAKGLVKPSPRKLQAGWVGCGAGGEKSKVWIPIANRYIFRSCLRTYYWTLGTFDR